MTAVTGRPPKETEANHRVKRRSRFLTIAVVVLGLIAIVLAVLVWTDRSAESAMPADVEQVIDDYTGAIAAGDRYAWEETVTDDYANRRYTFGSDHELWADWTLEEAANAYAFRIEFKPAVEYEQIGEPLVTGDGPWFVTVAQSWLEEEGDIVYDGSATYTVVERDGVVKVASEYFVGTASFAEE